LRGITLGIDSVMDYVDFPSIELRTAYMPVFQFIGYAQDLVGKLKCQPSKAAAAPRFAEPRCPIQPMLAVNNGARAKQSGREDRFDCGPISGMYDVRADLMNKPQKCSDLNEGPFAFSLKAEDLNPVLRESVGICSQPADGANRMPKAIRVKSRYQVNDAVLQASPA